MPPSPSTPNSVVLDLNANKIGDLKNGVNTEAVGITSTERRKNITIQNGAVRGVEDSRFYAAPIRPFRNFAALDDLRGIGGCMPWSGGVDEEVQHGGTAFRLSSLSNGGCDVDKSCYDLG